MYYHVAVVLFVSTMQFVTFFKYRVAEVLLESENMYMKPTDLERPEDKTIFLTCFICFLTIKMSPWTAIFYTNTVGLFSMKSEQTCKIYKPSNRYGNTNILFRRHCGVYFHQFDPDSSHDLITPLLLNSYLMSRKSSLLFGISSSFTRISSRVKFTNDHEFVQPHLYKFVLFFIANCKPANT